MESFWGNRLKWAVVVLLGIIGAVYGDWPEGQKMRFSLAPSYSRKAKVYFPLPVECLGKVTALRAVTDEGLTLPVAPVFSRGHLIGGVLNIPEMSALKESEAAKRRVFLYPAQGSSEGRLEMQVRVSQMIREMTTRPFTAEEMMRCFDEMVISWRHYKVNGYVNQFGEFPEVKKAGGQKKKHHSAAFISWEAMIHLEQEESLCFGSSAFHTAWCVLVDGEPVADWCSGSRSEQMICGKPKTLQEGMHTVQLLCIARASEKLPELQVIRAVDQKSVSLNWIASGDPQFIGVENRNGGMGIHYRPKKSLAFSATGRRLVELERIESHWAQGEEPVKSRKMLVQDACITPDIQLSLGEQSFRFPQRKRWKMGQTAAGRCLVENAPMIVPSNATVEVSFKGVWERQKQELPEGIRGRCEGVSPEGELLFAQETELSKEGVAHFTVPLTDKMSKICCKLLYCNDLQILHEGALRLVRPDRDFAGVSPQGEWLYQEGERVLLVCGKATPCTLSSAGNGKELLLDDLSSYLGANWMVSPIAAEMEKVLQRPCPSLICRAPLGTRRGLSQWTELERLSLVSAEKVFLLVGMSALQDGVLPENAVLQALFLAQWCQSNGKIPVLVTLPEVPSVDMDVLRLYALYLKEMAFSLHLPLVDLYSMQGLDSFTFRLSPVSRLRPVASCRWVAEKLCMEK